MGKFHDDGTLEIGGFGGEEIAEESSVVSDVDVLKKNIDKEFRKNRKYADERFRRLEHKYYQLCEDFKFKSRLYVITFCGLIVSNIGLLIRITIMSN